MAFNTNAFKRTDTGNASSNFVGTGVYFTEGDTLTTLSGSTNLPAGSVNILTGTYFGASAGIVPKGGLVVLVNTRVPSTTATANVRRIASVLVSNDGSAELYDPAGTNLS